MNKISIAIDGPAGSGKSTIAKIIAKKLGIIYVDTGAMYRAIALYFIENGESLNNTEYIISQLEFIDISIKYLNDEQHIFLNNKDVSSEIRNISVTEGSSIVSQISDVRKKLVSMQRTLEETQSIIMDGRDIGSHVLPNATLKIYLSADIDERVKRRCDDYAKLNEPFKLEEVKSAMLKRDFEDMNRKISPLKKADDAIEIDTTLLKIDEVVEKILSHLKILTDTEINK